MTTVARQVFAPLAASRLESISSLKNRQNGALASATAGKRKADLVDDLENVDPALFTKRAKASDLLSPAKSQVRPSSFVLKTVATPGSTAGLSLSSPAKPTSVRRKLQPKSQAAKLNAAQPKSSPVPAPAGRSPTLGKRAGLLSRSRRSVTDRLPPATPFSIDALLKGTTGGRVSTPRRNKGKGRLARGLESRASWFFEIHEDTPEQEMTNLLQHSTCVLDISSDEETSEKAIRERENGCDKENIPPTGDVCKESPRPLRKAGSMEEDRVPLGELKAADFYAPGLDAASAVLVDDDEETEIEDNCDLAGFEFAPKLNYALELESEDIDKLIGKPPESSSKSVVLKPLEGTDESFELWESSSAKDEAEA